MKTEQLLFKKQVLYQKEHKTRRKMVVGPNKFQNPIFSNSMGFSSKLVPFKEVE